jgi:hypothetical protein
MKTVTPKMRRNALEMRTFPGTKGNYLVFRTGDGAFHAFLEVQAKAAALDCGSKLSRLGKTTPQHWKSLWKDS